MRVLTMSMGLGLILVSLLIPLAMTDARAADTPSAIFPVGTRILFQGDSITDGGRGRSLDPNHILGQDYAYLVAARCGAAYPERHLTFLNRGVSGNKVNDLAARWQADTLDLKPDVLSVLIGVNDVWRTIGNNPQTTVADYEKGYDDLLARAVAANPQVKLVLCEPFILPGKNTSALLPEWQATIHQMQAAVGRLAVKYHAPVVHFQKVFDDAQKRAPSPDYWIWDGVHPTYSGHQLMADEWLRTYTTYYGASAPTRAK